MAGSRIRKILIFVLTVQGDFSCSASDETEFDSRFSYEVQLLEKMIRIEKKVEQMELEITSTQAKVFETLKDVTDTLDNKTVELELLQRRVDMPIVAFNVYNPVDKSIDTSQIVIFLNILLNEGNGYDNVLGIFTAPVTGLYYLAAHICNTASVGFYYDIVQEHSTIARSTKFNNQQHDCGTVTTVAKVTKGQRVWIKCTSGTTSNQLYEDTYRQSSFIGTLLQT